MKKYLICTLLAFPLIALFSCEMDMPTWDDQDRISIVYPILNTLPLSSEKYTFVYEPLDKTVDTIWLEVQTMGDLRNEKRQVTLRQAASAEGDIQAQPNTHFVPFDNAELMKHYFVDNNENGAKLPIVLKRDESLQEVEVSLVVELVENTYFKIGYPNRVFYTIYIADILTKPTHWGGQNVYYFAGEYGKRKHQLMIDWVREKDMVINDEWFESQGFVNSMHDMGLTAYWAGFFTDKLIAHNRQLQAEGKPVEKEEDGTIVQFKLNGTPQPYI